MKKADRRQQHQAVGVVPAALGDQRQDLEAEQLPEPKSSRRKAVSIRMTV